eukprot:scaffold1839_cov382-Prasinococcus_capsulatus_cf.AAC.23
MKGARGWGCRRGRLRRCAPRAAVAGTARRPARAGRRALQMLPLRPPPRRRASSRREPRPWLRRPSDSSSRGAARPRALRKPEGGAGKACVGAGWTDARILRGAARTPGATSGKRLLPHRWASPPAAGPRRQQDGYAKMARQRARAAPPTPPRPPPPPRR